MLYIASSFEYENSEFAIKEIYVSDENTLFILNKNDGYLPTSVDGDVKGLVDASKNSIYPLLGFSEIRTYNDSDPKSLANFFYKKIVEVDFSNPNADKALFNVISNFGEPYVKTSI
jgi:hypothetical protein